MKNFLIVVDMQKDFVDGALGTKEAVAIVPKVAEKIKNSPHFSKFRLVQGTETIRATVVGAGRHAVSLSGSTVYFPSDILPLKNIPVSVVSAQNPVLPETDTVTLFHITDVKDTSFSALHTLAHKIAKQAKMSEMK